MPSNANVPATSRASLPRPTPRQRRSQRPRATALVILLGLWVANVLALLLSGSASAEGYAAPDAQTGASGPRVLGLSAGDVSQFGDVEGAATVATLFSEAMDRASAQAAFAITPRVAGSFAWRQNTLLFTPSAPLASRTTYTVSISTQAKSARGRPLAAPFSTSFVTAPPPNILRTLPSREASDVPTDTIITLTFDRPMLALAQLDRGPDPGK